jgi:hypothetical protein
LVLAPRLRLCKIGINAALAPGSRALIRTQTTGDSIMNDMIKPRIFPASDELPHEIGEHPLWQESVFLVWADVNEGIFGFHRIGQECNARDGQGMVTSWNGIATREGVRFGRYLFEPMRPGDRHAGGFGAAGVVRMNYDGATNWRIDDPDCTLDLVSRDYTPRFDLFKDSGSVVENFAKGHIEVGGDITGTVRLGRTTHRIDGMAYRDHSWGKRDRSTMLSHRWIAGTVGPELTFNATAWHATDGSLQTYGIVCRRGEIAYARHVDIVVFMEIDAVSHRGGVLTMTLENGEVIELRPTLVDAFLTQHHNTGVIDALCEVEWNGRRGFCDFEISTNPRAGTAPIPSLVRATRAQGISMRDWTL